MDVKIIPNNDFIQLFTKIKSIEHKIDKLMNKEPLKEKWLTIPEVCEILKVSTRTLQNYRDTGILSFSQIGAKIYFKASEIQNHLEKHNIQGFKKN